MAPSMARGRASGPENQATAPSTTTIASRLTVLTVVSSKVMRSVSEAVADGRAYSSSRLSGVTSLVGVAPRPLKTGLLENVGLAMVLLLSMVVERD